MIGRRIFLKMLAVAPFAALADKAVEARSEKRTVDLAEFPVAGFQYHDGMKSHVMASLAVGTELRLVREPGNRYDDKAIALHSATGAMIGYIPRDLNSIPAAMLDQNVRLQTSISSVTPDAATWERVRVVVRQVV